ncbi:hypothetical protein D3C76_1666470 [compost metagenome]
MSHRLDVDVQADETQAVWFLMAQFNLHLYPCIGGQVNDGIEILGQVGIPICRAFDQQTFE